MKTAGFLLALCCACFVQARAQVSISVSFDQGQFLPGEALNANVRIANFSGQTLHLGEDEGWLKFIVASRDGSIVLKNGEAPVMEKIELESSKAMIKKVNLAPYFDLKRPGQFSLMATATIKDWNKQISSAPVDFDIVNAAMLWSREFGVPQAPGTTNSQPPEVRKYALLQANHLQKLTLYFQLTDAVGKPEKVYALGRMMNIDKPEAEIDRFSNLHILYQIGAHSVCYARINTDGELVVRQTYDFLARPRLRFDERGNVIVTGAERRPTADDLPPLTSAEVKTN